YLKSPDCNGQGFYCICTPSSLNYLLNKQSDNGLHTGRDRLFSLLKKRRLRVPVRPVCHKATDSHHSDHGIQYFSVPYQSIQAG
ncbi:putative integrase, partial [Pectobacterium atrosepticum SCRI1043]